MEVVLRRRGIYCRGKSIVCAAAASPRSPRLFWFWAATKSIPRTVRRKLSAATTNLRLDRRPSHLTAFSAFPASAIKPDYAGRKGDDRRSYKIYPRKNSTRAVSFCRHDEHPKTLKFLLVRSCQLRSNTKGVFADKLEIDLGNCSLLLIISVAYWVRERSRCPHLRLQLVSN